MSKILVIAEHDGKKLNQATEHHTISHALDGRDVQARP